jgi:hypothetical protein
MYLAYFCFVGVFEDFIYIDNLLYWDLEMKGEANVRKMLHKEAKERLFNSYE